MAYQDKDKDFLPDFQAAEALAIQKYGDFYHPVDSEVAWKAYSNAKKKAVPGNGVLGLMLMGRHKTSHNVELNRMVRNMAAEDERLKDKWYVPKAYREHKWNQAMARVENLGAASLDPTRPPPPPPPPSWQSAPQTHSGPGRWTRTEETEEAKKEREKKEQQSVMVKNFGIVNNKESGSILLMGSANWNFTVNDCWVVGAVHSHLPFYPASAVSEANIFDAKHVLSITGRELYGLAIFGYRHSIGHPSIGSAFEVQNPGKATGATLVAYQQAMNALTRAGAWKAFEDAGFQIAKIGF